MGRQPAFVVEDQSEVIAFLEAHLSPVKRIDTHGAVVFLAGARAYKLKRAVKFPYMDFSTVERRAAMCAAEIEINRRLAPEIYLGTAAVWRGRDGKPALGEVGEAAEAAIDWLVVMHRFDEEGLLDRMAERGALTSELMAALGARVARFHDGLAPIKSGFCTPDDYRHSVAADVRQMREAGDRLDPPTSEALAEAMPKALEPHMELVARRVVAGAVRRCHGDLHLRNIVLIDGWPVPFDAIEFSERIANIDVLYDLSFTLMDLCERMLRPLANRLLNEWLWRIAELAGAPHEEALALLPMFLSRRASIRAFVDAQAAAVSGADASRARDYQKIALSFLRPVPPRLVAIGGLSGSGKTTLALRMAPEIGRAPGAVVVRSDVERKRRAGVALEDRMPAGSYTSESSATVYAAFLARAERVLRAGHSVVLDAVFAHPDERAAAEALAAKVGVPFEGIWLDVPKEVAQARVAARKVDASDATPAVVERQFGYDLGEIRWRRLS
jgi:aminoglycoside phosphotransferase family enzyme/predicted kinase